MPPNMEPKDRILEKSDELFNRYGIRSVSMDDIASQLGMSKKTLYQYYADKDELVTDVFTSIMECNKHRCTEGHELSENALHEVFLSFDMGAGNVCQYESCCTCLKWKNIIRRALKNLRNTRTALCITC